MSGAFFSSKLPTSESPHERPLANSISQCSEDTSQNSGACSCTIACEVTVRRKKVKRTILWSRNGVSYLKRIAGPKASHSLPARIFLSNSVRFVNQTKALVAMIYDIYLLTAIGLSPGGRSTVHIYTQIIYRTIQNKQYIEQHSNFGRVRAVPRFG